MAGSLDKMRTYLDVLICPPAHRDIPRVAPIHIVTNYYMSMRFCTVE